MTPFGRFLPIKATQCAGQIDANDWSSRMQMGGQVHATSRLGNQDDQRDFRSPGGEDS